MKNERYDSGKGTKVLGFVVLASVLVLGSCVSVSEYRQLENEFSSYKESMQTRQVKLEEDMKIFKMGYDPQARDIFEYNVVQAGRYYSEIVSIRNEISSMSDLLEKIKYEAETAKNTVVENARTSQSQNVVNEFYYLRRQWDTTVSEMNKLVFTAQQSVGKAQTAVSESYARVVAAERAAKSVNDVALNLNNALANLTSISQRLANLEQAIALDKKSDAETQKVLDDIALKLKGIFTRIDALEKFTGTGTPTK